jgi:hypothetical protein
MLVDRLYPALNRHELATADGEAINLRWENQMREAAAELDRILGIDRPPLVDACASDQRGPRTELSLFSMSLFNPFSYEAGQQDIQAGFRHNVRVWALC